MDVVTPSLRDFLHRRHEEVVPEGRADGISKLSGTTLKRGWDAVLQSVEMVDRLDDSEMLTRQGEELGRDRERAVPRLVSRSRLLLLLLLLRPSMPSASRPSRSSIPDKVGIGSVGVPSLTAGVNSRVDFPTHSERALGQSSKKEKRQGLRTTRYVHQSKQVKKESNECVKTGFAIELRQFTNTYRKKAQADEGKA